MSDRELITTTLRIQEFRGWSNRRLATVAGLSYQTWYGVLNRPNGRANSGTRAKLQAFVTKWSDNRRPSPQPEYKSLAQKARAIQERREWNTYFCSDLAGVSWNTWHNAVCIGSTRILTEPVRAKLQTFVDAWADDNRPAPRRHTAPNGVRFGQPKVTETVRLAIVASPKPHAVVGAEFGVSLSTVYRIRLRDRMMREAS